MTDLLDGPDDPPVPCPTCAGVGSVRHSAYRPPDDCSDCAGSGEVSREAAEALARNHAELREMSEDDRAHAWRERMDERGMP